MTLLISIIICLFIVPIIFGTAALFLFSGKNSHSLKHKTPVTAVLLFHSVTNTQSIEQSYITTLKLQQFLDYLNNHHYKTLTVYETALLSKATIDSKTSYITITFDDGFENFYTNVHPIFKRYNMKATIFPIVNCIDSQFYHWDIYPPQKHLTQKQIRSISDAGHEIGSHTMTHPDLVLLSDKYVHKELSDSKKTLEDIIEKPVKSISFPFGSWNMRVWNQARKCGYEAAVVYRKHYMATPGVIPATGVYAFDTVEDIIEKIENRYTFSNSRSRSFVMPHFAKGTPVWKFRKTYNIFNLFH